MAARRMATDHQRAPKSRQRARSRPHLPDNLIDGNMGTKVIARNGDADPMGIQPTGEVAEKRTIQRLPVTAMNENDNRAFILAGKKIDHVARAGSVGHGAWG